MKVKHYPLSKNARIGILAAFIINIITWLTVAYYYPTLSTRPAALWVPVVFFAIFLLLLLTIWYRYTILEKYPYLFNLPSFVYRLGMEKDPEKGGMIINRVFSVYSLVLLFLSVLNLAITYIVMQSITNNAPTPVLLVLYLFIIAFIIGILLFYRSIYRSFAVKG